MNNDKTFDSRVDSILLLLSKFSTGNFDAREKVPYEDDALSTIISGLNMLGEELSFYQQQANDHHDFLQGILGSIDEVIYARSIILNDPRQSPFTFISGRAMEIIGYSTEDLRQEPDKWLNAIHPDDTERSAEVINKVLGGDEATFIYRIFHNSLQQYRWIEDRVVPKKNAEGVVVSIYGSARDITDQQNINLELDHKNKLVSQLITSSDQAFYIISIDPENSFKNTCTYISWQIEKIQGSTIEEIKNNPLHWFQSIHPDDVGRLKEDNRRMFSTKNPVTRVYRIKHARTGQYVWVEDYVLPVVNEDGIIKEFYGSARDITQRKTVELEREKLIMELNNRHEEVLQFSHIVSHNLRSPVASIIGLSQVLQPDMPFNELAATTGYMVQAAHAMDEVLHDLNMILSMRPTLKEKAEPFLVSKIVQSACNILAFEIAETGTTLEINIEPGADEIVSVKSYIQSAVYNLLSNAIKYRTDGIAPVIKVNASFSDGHYIIAVADNGMGINLAKHRHRLFALYSRLHKGKDGKGLGLYMTKKQMEALNGKLLVESEEGVGSTFTIIL